MATNGCLECSTAAVQWVLAAWDSGVLVGDYLAFSSVSNRETGVLFGKTYARDHGEGETSGCNAMVSTFTKIVDPG